MARQIWKYALAVKDGIQSQDMPVGNRIRHVGSQHGEIMLWAEVNPAEDLKPRKFRVYGTGQPMESFDDQWGDSSIGLYLGTVQMNEFVWHVYDVTDYHRA